MMRWWMGALVVVVGVGAAAGRALVATSVVVQGPQVSTAADAKAALMAEGAEIYAVECTTCHAPDGGSDQGPALAGNTAIASTDFVAKRLLDGVKDMPAFAPTLSDRQIAAVATFIRNSWDNDHGVVLETEIAKLRSTPIKTAPGKPLASMGGQHGAHGNADGMECPGFSRFSPWGVHRDDGDRRARPSRGDARAARASLPHAVRARW